jgi:ABC-2 type transport system ATP-binding protein
MWSGGGLTGQAVSGDLGRARMGPKTRKSEVAAVEHDVLVEAEGLRKTYPGGVAALRGVSFRVRRGDRVCLLGPNGAGKTTVIRLLTGALAPNAGAARLMGASVGSPAYRQAKRAIGIVPEAPGMYRELTTGDYLRFVRDIYGKGSVAEVASAFELGPYLDRPMSALSGGFQRRLCLAAAILPEPELLILDEPTARLDPLAASQVRHYIRRAIEGRTMLLCTHNLAEAEELCDRVVILRQGEVLVEDELESLRERFARHLEIEAVEPPERVAAAIRATGSSARIAGDVVRVPVVDYRREVPTLLASLLGAGLHVYGARVHEPSLEDIFLRLLGEPDDENEEMKDEPTGNARAAVGAGKAVRHDA